MSDKSFMIILICVAALYDFNAFINIRGGQDIDRQSKAIHQLRPQFSLFRVARSNQHETRGMADGKPLAFHNIFARLRHIQQKIHDVIFQQIHLIYIEIPPVRLGK